MNPSVNSSQPTSQRPERTLGRKPFHKLGKLFGLKNGTDVSSSSSSRHNSRTSTPRPNSSLASVAFPSPTFSSTDNTRSTAQAFVDNGPLRRPHLSHSASTPTMSMHYQASSESSTRSTTPVDGDRSPSSVMHSMPAGNEVKELPASLDSSMPDVKWPWKWRRANSERRTRLASSNRSTPAKISSFYSMVSPTSSPLWDGSFTLTPPLSSTSSSSPDDELHLTPITSTDSATPSGMQYSAKPVRPHSRRQSASKLARTLGASPPQGGFDSLPEEKSSFHNVSTEGPRSRTDDSLTEAPKSPRAKRMSLKLTTTLSLLRPPSRSQLAPHSRSKIPLSTLNTDGVHRFGLTDDLSDNLGEFRDDSRASAYSSPTISPITFKPPTPVAVVPPRRFSTLNLASTASTAKVKPDEVTLSSPNLETTLNRSRSLSFAPPRIGRLAQLAHAHSAAESRPHTSAGAVDETRLPVKANWLESPIQEEEAKAQSFIDTHPEYADEYKSWSGQWNQDDMQHVIKMLRSLK